MQEAVTVVDVFPAMQSAKRVMSRNELAQAASLHIYVDISLSNDGKMENRVTTPNQFSLDSVKNTCTGTMLRTVHARPRS